MVIVPIAIAYDLVLEDHILARQRVKRRQRPFARELAEMVRYAVGYRSRAFVTFGAPIALTCSTRTRGATCSTSRTARATRSAGSYKVLPTAVVAAAMRPSITRRELEARARRPHRHAAAPRAPTWASPTAARRSTGPPPLEDRGIIVVERGALPRARAERAALLRAGDRAPAADASEPDPLMLDALSKRVPHPRPQPRR